MRGLCDTDGTLYGVHKRSVSITTVDPILRDQYIELARSLGYKVRSRFAPNEYNGSWQVLFTVYRGDEAFSFPRKVNLVSTSAPARPGETSFRFIKSITPVASVPVRCIGVDAEDHLFLAGEAMVPTHNTEMFLNWLAYSVKCDPADMMLVQTSQTTARDFSMRRVDRMHRHSPSIGELLGGGKSSDNTFDKHYRTGMMLSLSWPTINELSGKPIPRQFLTDFDRMSDDIDGEGNPFDLTAKRGTTFGRNRMTAAESSPGYIVENPKWTRKTAHEAPPTKGILALYNRGDRRRWYWNCQACHGKFEPDFKLLKWPDSKDKMESAEQAVMECPHCGQEYHHDPRDGLPGKHEMNRHGRWVRDGMVWTPDGEMVGTPIRSSIASFWLKGTAAAFASWETLVFNWLSANEDYDNSQSEEALKTTVNTDQGDAYTPKSMANDRVPETIKSQAKPLGFREVPAPVRFLIATVDVQKNRFVVQVHGIALNSDVYVIDRFEIKKSKREDTDAGGMSWVNPGAYPEDWKLLAEQVINLTYPLSDGSGRQMAVKLTLCDSGGKAGVTANAYDFVRWLRYGDAVDEDGNPTESVENQEEGTYEWKPGMAGRFLLVKGASTKNGPRVKLDYPDSQRSDRHAGARGEIPVLFLNTNALKDMVDNRLDRTVPGGRFVFPDWLDDNFYIELTVEVKDPAKGWINPKNYRNESWDLLAYCMAGTLTAGINLEYMDVANPPTWAAEWDLNDLVFDPVEKKTPYEGEKKSGRSLAKLASNLA